MKATEIQGWMTPLELHWLEKHGRRCQRIVEVGSWKGRSTRALASGGAHVFAVDSWLGTPNNPATQEKFYPDADQVFLEFCANMKGLKVTPQRMDSLEAAALLAREIGRTFDMVFIDADHAYEAVKADILAYRPLLKPCGLLSGHDYGQVDGVTQAVDELLPDMVRGPDSIWWVRV